MVEFEISEKDLVLSENLDEEIIKNSAYYSHFSFRYAQLQSALLVLEAKLEEMKVKKYIEFKDRYNYLAQKITEKEMQYRIDNEPEIKETKKEIERIKQELIKVDRILRVLDHRKDLLVTLCANKRVEKSLGV